MLNVRRQAQGERMREAGTGGENERGRHTGRQAHRERETGFIIRTHYLILVCCIVNIDQCNRHRRFLVPDDIGIRVYPIRCAGNLRCS